MHVWLAEALDSQSCILTASRRLARSLSRYHGQEQVSRGVTAWPTPAIYFWRDWLSVVLSADAAAESLPARINASQSRLLWERSLAKEIDDPLLNSGLLIRQLRDSWQVLQDWEVLLDTCKACARGRDQRLFVRVARSYAARLQRERWLDAAGLPGLVSERIAAGLITPPEKIYLAGFDRLVPQLQTLRTALERAGCVIERVGIPRQPGFGAIYHFDSVDAELRAAGVWARRSLEAAPGQRIGIVVAGLEQHAPRALRLVSEGFSPGWQYVTGQPGAAVDISYGRPLLDYPAVRVAALTLSWLQTDLTSAEVGVLLRSPILGSDNLDARSRLESALRRRPAQSWSPQRLLAYFESVSSATSATGWMTALQGLVEVRVSLPRNDHPAAWAAVFSNVLEKFGWPGPEALGGGEFQLLNRWRELLNELAGLGLVAPRMRLAEALRRLAAMAGETIFQPESSAPVLQVVGPLEAAGLEFDRLWVAGLTAANWPPAATPLALLSRDLQRELRMPDATPDDTLEYAQRVIKRLAASAAAVVGSYALHEGDAEQTLSQIAAGYGPEPSTGPDDPGWNADSLRELAGLAEIVADPVPPVAANEAITGGAATLQRQRTEPFSAFAHGRLGIRPMLAYSPGVSPLVRGTILHDTLRHLLTKSVTRDGLVALPADGLGEQIRRALRRALKPWVRGADSLLRTLLELEAERDAELVRQVVALDCGREDFAIEAVEKSLDTEIAGVCLRLRIDRIDCLPDKRLLVWDYKTGRSKKLLDRSGEPTDIQLFVYAFALPGEIAGLGLYNIDSRSVHVDFIGESLAGAEVWNSSLQDWRDEVLRLAAAFARGDVRVNRAQSVSESRPLALLSRFPDMPDERTR